MSEYVLSPQAILDLNEIWDYSARMWNAEQADDYIRLISGACHELGTKTRSGRSVDELRSGYLKYLVGSHVVFYRWSSNEFLEVVRILHQRMDIELHL